MSDRPALALKVLGPIERGDRTPRPETLRQIADALGVTITRLGQPVEVPA